MGLLPVTVLTVAGYILLLLIVNSLLSRLSEHRWKNWVTIIINGFMTVAVTTIVAPYINDAWTRNRDLEQRRLNARTTHLERLRPILRAHAKQLTTMADNVSEMGHFTGGAGGSRDALAQQLENVWVPNLLSRDFEAHYSDFWKEQEKVRTLLASQENEIRDLVSAIVQELKLSPNDNREGVAYSLVRQCMNRGSGISLKVYPGGTGYSYSATGGSQSGGGAPPDSLVAADKAYREFKRGAAFDSACEKLRSRADELPSKIRSLSKHADEFAEMATLRGDCPYTKLD